MLASSMVSVHIWSLVFSFIGVARGKWLVAENLVRPYMLSTILGAFVNVGFNLWLIPRYAGLGAASATLIAYAVAGYFSCLLLPQLRPAFGPLSLSLLIPFRVRSLGRSFHEIL